MPNAELPKPKPSTHGRRLASANLNGLIVTLAQYPPGLTIPTHDHALPGITVVVAGQLTEGFARQLLTVPTHALIAKPPDASHWDRYGPDGAVCLVIEAREWRADAIRRETDILDRLGVIASDPLRTATARVIARLGSGPRSDWTGLERRLLELLFVAGRAAEANRRTPLWLPAVREYLNQSFTTVRRVDQVAAVARVHSVHLARVFRASFGCSVGAYVRRLRVEAAAKHLAESSRPISRIAQEVGFTDQPHLTRVFRARYGVTPARFRAGGLA